MKCSESEDLGPPFLVLAPESPKIRLRLVKSVDAFIITSFIATIS